MRTVVLPQAIRRVAPPLLNDFISLQKDTALVAALGLVRPRRCARRNVYASLNFNYTSLVVAALFFIAATIPLARLTDYIGYAADRAPALGGRRMTAVRLENVYKQYGDHLVLKGVDLEVEPHQVVALIGSSGSGKSTLLRCVNLLEQVDDGQIWLGDTDITAVDIKPDQVRRRVGMVFQSFNLFPHMTALDNVTLAARKVHGMRKSKADEKATGAARHDSGLGGKESSYPDRLSGGQQQRVAFARSLMTDPEVVLLDEVTSALDPELVGDVLDIIRDLKESGITMMMATHEMQFCREIADQVCFLDAGRILERGTADEVFGAPEGAADAGSS